LQQRIEDLEKENKEFNKKYRNLKEVINVHLKKEFENKFIISFSSFINRI